MFISHTFWWRGSKRSCDVLFTNVRILPDESLRSGDDWKLIIDFPFDTENHSPIEDLDRINKFRDQNERQRTLVWLPSFFSTRTQAELGQAGHHRPAAPGQQPRSVRPAPVAARPANRPAPAPEPAECPVTAIAPGGRGGFCHPIRADAWHAGRCLRHVGVALPVAVPDASSCNVRWVRTSGKHWSICSTRRCRISSRSTPSSGRRSSPAGT